MSVRVNLSLIAPGLQMHVSQSKCGKMLLASTQPFCRRGGGSVHHLNRPASARFWVQLCRSVALLSTWAMHQLVKPSHGIAMPGCRSCNLLDRLPSVFKDAKGLEVGSAAGCLTASAYQWGLPSPRHAMLTKLCLRPSAEQA